MRVPPLDYVGTSLVNSGDPASARMATYRARRTKALTALASSLPPLIDTYRKLSGLPPFSQERVAPLVILHRLIPTAQAALGPDFHRGTRSASWHPAASMIAAEAKDAWDRPAARSSAGTLPAPWCALPASSCHGQGSSRTTIRSPSPYSAESWATKPNHLQPKNLSCRTLRAAGSTIFPLPRRGRGADRWRRY